MANKGLQLSNKGNGMQLSKKSEGYIFGAGAFGSQIWQWVSGKVPFYPLFQNFFINRKLPIYVDMNNLMLVYLSIPDLRIIIDKKADMMRNARLCVYKEKDWNEKGKYATEVDHDVLHLLANPNPLQTWSTFISQHCNFFNIYSNSFLYKFGMGGKQMPKVLWNLPPGEMKIIPTGNLFFESVIQDIIEKYTLWNSGQYQPIDFDPKSIITLTQGTSDKFFFGESKILTGKIIISNLDLIHKTYNCTLQDRGAFGIISADGKDGLGGMPLGDDEKKRIEEHYRKSYGVGEDQMKTMITTASVKYQSMSYPTKDLMLFEGREEYFGMLCAMFGLERSVFPESSASKPQAIGSSGQGKVEEGYRLTYQNTIQQEIDAFCNMINQDPCFQLRNQGYILKAHFNHIPMMQENELERETIRTSKAAASASITTSVISLNAAIIAGTIEREVAVSTLVNIFDIEPKEAETLITKQEPVEEENEPIEPVKEASKKLSDNFHTHLIRIKKSLADSPEKAKEIASQYGNTDKCNETKVYYLFEQIPKNYFIEDSMVIKSKTIGISFKMGILKPEYQYNFKP